MDQWLKQHYLVIVYTLNTLSFKKDNDASADAPQSATEKQKAAIRGWMLVVRPVFYFNSRLRHLILT